MALDEAGNVSPPRLQDKLKIGRFRNTPYLLGFQDVSQIKSRFQENGGKAVLAGMKNQIFLPGIDPETGAYASSMLGPTTVLSRTEVDATGTSNDAERVSESRRDLRQAPELRRLVKYRQGIAVIDTADPILFRFLPRADVGDVAIPPERELAEPERLADAVSAMKAITDAEKRRGEEQQINEPTTRKKEKVNPREEPGSKPTLQPIDLSNLIEPESEEEN
jgi:type IV secretory pathway TraG/TraD family ATPase VirD4